MQLRHCALLVVSFFTSLHVTGRAAPPAAPAPIPWHAVGEAATRQLPAAMEFARDADGNASFRCALQQLEGRITAYGLRLGEAEQVAVRAVSASRAGAEDQVRFSDDGSVEVAPGLTRWIRAGLVEEFSLSADGVRQDFLVSERPDGEGDLRVALAIEGASVSGSGNELQLAVQGSGRALTYGGLFATDARGRELPAHFEVRADGGADIVVADAGAAYPIRIDPTFSDADWYPFTKQGLNPGGIIHAIVASSSNLYVGGSFTNIAGVAACGIAKWNGTSWVALATTIIGRSQDYGLNWIYTTGRVGCLALDASGNLYAAGYMYSINGVGVEGIAKWNGSSWSSMAGGVPPIDPGNGGPYDIQYVADLRTDGSGNVYAAGNFWRIGGVSATNVAKWNGSSWSALGTGLDGEANVLAFDSTGNLYAGGEFVKAGGVEAPHIAKWNGASWSALGAGLGSTNYAWQSYVNALAVDASNNVYAGGFFTNAGALAVQGIAKWNGSAWSALGSGTTGKVHALRFDTLGKLYAGGDFQAMGGIPARRVAQWTGSSWLPVGSGMSGGGYYGAVVYDLALDGAGGIVAGGDFDVAGGSPAKGLARFDREWLPMAVMSGLGHSNIYCTVSDTNRGLLYVGGWFTNIGGVAATNIAVWNGRAWSQVGDGLSGGQVSALAIDADSNVVAVGDFTSSGGFGMNHVASWDGSSWSPLGGGLSDHWGMGPHNVAADSRGNVYATTRWLDGYNHEFDYVNKWNGASWATMGDPGRIHGYISALEIRGTNIYVGGSFLHITDRYWYDDWNIRGVAKWGGTNWVTMGLGTYESVYDLALDSAGTPYIAGDNFVYRYNGGTNWVPYWTNGSSGISGILVDDAGTIIICDGWTAAGTNVPNHVAAWNGSSWQAVGLGLDTYPNGIDLDPWGRLIAFGHFTNAAGKSCGSLAYAVLRQPKIQLVGLDNQYIASDEVVSVPKGTDFDDVTPAGRSITNILRILNLGSADLAISGVTTGGAGAAAFRVLAYPSSIGYNTISNIAVVFTPPATPGIYEATLLIANNVGSTFRLNVRGSSGCKYIEASRNTDLGDLDPIGHVPVYTGSNMTFTMFSENNRLPVTTIDSVNRGVLYAHTFTNVVDNTHSIAIDFQVDTIVSGVICTQRSLRSRDKYIDIRYSLSDLDTSTVTIAVAISTDGGTTFNLIPATVSGDIGEGIMPGSNKSILWLAHRDWDGQYSDTAVVRITATDDNGDAVGQTGVLTLDTEYGIRPRITDLRGLHNPYSGVTRDEDYFNKDTEAFFLDTIGLGYGLGGSFEVSCDVVMDWKGITPGEVRWFVNNQQSGAYADSVDPTFNISDGFGVGGTLEAIAVGNLGATNEARSTKIRANFQVLPPPKLWTRYTATAPMISNTKKYTFLRPNVSYSQKSEETVPDKTPSGKDVPGAKDKNQYSAPLTFEMSGEVDMRDPGGNISASLSKEFEVKEFSVSPKVSGGVEFDYQEDDAAWDYGGYIGLSVDVSRETQPRYFCKTPPLYGKLGAHIEVGGEIHFNRYFEPKWGETKITLTPGIWGVVGCGLPGFANIEGKVGIDLPNEFTVQPFTYSLKLDLSAALSAQFLMWSVDIWSEHWQFDIYSYSARPLAYIEGKANDDLMHLKPGEFQLISRDYLHEKGEARSFFNVYASRDGTVLGEAARAPEPQAGEVFVKDDTFPYSEPSLDVAGTNRMMLWIGDAGTNRITQNANTLFWETWGGTNWTDRGILADDGTGDSTPQLQLQGNGTALAAWQNGAYVLSATSGLAEAMAALEIAVGRYNGTSWTSYNLTTNSVMDRNPQLALAANGNAMLAWVRNGSALDTNSLFTTAPDSLCFSIWNGSSWSQPAIALTNIGMVIGHSVAYNGSQGYLSFAMDTDYDLSTTTDQELFGMFCNNGVWASVTQFTRNAVQDTRPQATYNSYGILVFYWLQDGKIVDGGYNNGYFGPEVVAEIDASSAAQDFRLLTGGNGETAIIWEDSREVPYYQNPHLLVNNGSFPYRWSKPVQLLSDSALERSFSGTFSSSGTIVLAYNKVEVQLSPANTVTQLGPVVVLASLERTLACDLAVYSSELSLSTNNPQPGTTVTVYAVVRNIGELPAGDTRLMFYDGNPAAGGTLIGYTNMINFDYTWYNPGYLDGGATASVTTAWVVPASTSNHVIYAVTTSLMADRDPANNTAATTVMTPDLRFRSLGAERTAMAQRELSAAIINDGVIVAGSNTVVFRRDATNGAVLYEGKVPTLTAGSRATNTFTWDMSGETFTDDFVMVYATVDTSNEVTEAREDNNFRSMRVITPLDTDSDGLLNGEEGRYGTSVTNSDTDADGISDYDEVHGFGSNPADADSDQDGLNDGQEVARSTEFDNADTDGDGFSDGVETSQGTDPLNSSSQPTAMLNLVIKGNPASYGISRPYGFGTNKYSSGQSVTSSISEFVMVASGTRQACTGWTGTGSVPASGSGTQVIFTITQNSVLTWQWQKQYQLEVEVLPDGVSSNGGGILTGAGDGWYAAGSSVTITAAPDAGYAFAGWSGDVPTAQTNTNPLVLSLTNRTTVLARFARRTTTLQVISAYGTPSPAGTTTNVYGEVVAVSVNSPIVQGGTSFFCTGWTLSGQDPLSGSDTVAVITHTNSATLTWHWTTNVLLVASAGANGSLTGDGTGWYPVGATVTVTALPNSLYWFSHWTGVPAGQTNANPLVFTMNVARTISAQFVRQVATVTVVRTPAAGGNVSGGGTYFTGSNVTLSATASVNWAFGSWNDGDTNRTRTITVPATNITYTATFTQQMSTISLVVNPSIGGTPTGAGLYYAGSNATLSVLLTPNWRFTNWNDGNTNLTRTIVVPTTNIAYTANVYRLSPSYWYVTTNGNDTNAGTAWTNAKRTIQAAIDVAYTNDIITVSNGVYDTGGRTTGGYGLTNRVAIDKPLLVRSLNGPGVTVIRGAGPIGPTAVRGVYVGAGATLAGFTVTNGATLANGNENYELCGGGVRAAASAVISNCVIAGNEASVLGGGGCGGTYHNCFVLGNTAPYAGGVENATLTGCIISGNTATDQGGGAAGCMLTACTVADNVSLSSGGGAIQCTMSRCIVKGNQAANRGGGAYLGTLDNCVLAGNVADRGAGAYYATLNNCTLFGNDAATGAGGAAGGTVRNSILYFNTAPVAANYDDACDLANSCATPLPSGSGNTDVDPQFVDAAVTNLRLQAWSPCIDAGVYLAAAGLLDLDLHPRLTNAAMDMGAFEYQGVPSSNDADDDGIPNAWEAAYGLNPGGSNAPDADADADGRTDWQEYISDTHPTNGSSFFPNVALTNPPPGTMSLVLDPTSTGRIYEVQYSTNLPSDTQAWYLYGSGLFGTGAELVFTVTNDAPMRTYRTSVRLP